MADRSESMISTIKGYDEQLEILYCHRIDYRKQASTGVAVEKRLRKCNDEIKELRAERNRTEAYLDAREDDLFVNTLEVLANIKKRCQQRWG